MSFWLMADFAHTHKEADHTNESIWSESARVHEDAGFRPAEMLAPGAYGAQQAMLDPGVLGPSAAGCVLPWVPDLIGEDWRHPDAVHVVGMAYAGFILGLSKRNLPVADYASASREPWHVFAEAFVKHVVRGADRFYEPLADIFSCFGTTSRFTLFDLCRASLVRRGAPKPGQSRFAAPARVDTPLKLGKPDRLAQETFAKYAEHQKSEGWTWARLEQSAGKIVIALGLTSEHGLLRLFRRRNLKIWAEPSGKLWEARTFEPEFSWCVNYAGRSTLGSRLKSHSWWGIGAEVGSPRWCVVPIYHPSVVNQHDPGYGKTRSLVAAVRQNLT